MSSATLPCTDGLPTLLLVEPRMANSIRAAQLSRQRFCVTQTDCALDIFLLRHILGFSVAVLNDQVGTRFLCSAAENVRWQWPLARILILGQIPATMNDQLYDDVAVHSMDETAFLSAIDKLAEDRWKQVGDPLHAYLQGPSAPFYSTQVTDCGKAIQQSLWRRFRKKFTCATSRRAYTARIAEAKMFSGAHPVLRALAILGIVACFVCLRAYGQHVVRDLSGIVTDGHHEPLRGAIVQVHSGATGTVASYITDRTGRYSFKRLEGDLDYTIWATWNGKRSSVKKLSLFDTNTAKVIDIEVTPDH